MDKFVGSWTLVGLDLVFVLKTYDYQFFGRITTIIVPSRAKKYTICTNKQEHSKKDIKYTINAVFLHENDAW